MMRRAMTSEPAQSPQLSDPGQSPGSFHREIRAWARDLLLALCFAFVIIVFLYQPVKVEGTSMAPMISDQERIFINKLVYHFEPIQRGDVVVFWYPLDPAKSYIKRVIGLPGETVRLVEGDVYINGRKLDEPYVPPEYREEQSLGPIRVPLGEFFVLGDHRRKNSPSGTRMGPKL